MRIVTLLLVLTFVFLQSCTVEQRKPSSTSVVETNTFTVTAEEVNTSSITENSIPPVTTETSKTTKPATFKEVIPYIYLCVIVALGVFCVKSR